MDRLPTELKLELLRACIGISIPTFLSLAQVSRAFHRCYEEIGMAQIRQRTVLDMGPLRDAIFTIVSLEQIENDESTVYEGFIRESQEDEWRRGNTQADLEFLRKMYWKNVELEEIAQHLLHTYNSEYREYDRTTKIPEEISAMKTYIVTQQISNQGTRFSTRQRPRLFHHSNLLERLQLETPRLRVNYAPREVEIAILGLLETAIMDILKLTVKFREFLEARGFHFSDAEAAGRAQVEIEECALNIISSQEVYLQWKMIRLCGGRDSWSKKNAAEILMDTALKLCVQDQDSTFESQESLTVQNR